MPIWAIMLLPILFTVGMCLVDTLDGILMLGAYGWAFVKPARKLYYNAGITSLSVLVAFVVGTLELAQVISTGSQAGFAQMIGRIDLDRAGFVIVGIFALIWIGSIARSRRRLAQKA
jgi:high-affinity nickel-transport protein